MIRQSVNYSLEIPKKKKYSKIINQKTKKTNNTNANIYQMKTLDSQDKKIKTERFVSGCSINVSA